MDGRCSAQSQRLLARHVPHLDHAGRAVDVGDAPVHARLEIHGLHAGDRAGREEREQRAPRERRTVGDAQLEPAVDHEPVGHAALGPQLARRELEHVLHDAVHLADAVETGGGRDLRHRQVGVVEQAPGEVRAARTRDLARGRADVLRRTGAAGGARSHRGASARSSSVMSSSAPSAMQCMARHTSSGAAIHPTSGTRSGTAPQARPEAGGFRGGRVTERQQVASQRRGRATHRRQ